MLRRADHERSGAGRGSSFGGSGSGRLRRGAIGSLYGPQWAVDALSGSRPDWMSLTWRSGTVERSRAMRGYRRAIHCDEDWTQLASCHAGDAPKRPTAVARSVGMSAAPVGSSNGREKGTSMSGFAVRVEHFHVPARVARSEPHVLPPPDGRAVARCTLVSVLRQVCSITSDVAAVWMQQSNPKALDPLNPGLDLSYGRHRSDIMPDGTLRTGTV